MDLLEYGVVLSPIFAWQVFLVAKLQRFGKLWSRYLRLTSPIYTPRIFLLIASCPLCRAVLWCHSHTLYLSYFQFLCSKHCTSSSIATW